MSYRIITDSCCDFTPAQYKEFNLDFVPMTIMYKNEPHDDFLDEKSIKMVYEGLRNGETASTSAVNPDSWANAMENVLAQGQDALVLAFSSGLSTTYQSAVIAAEDLKEKYPQRKVIVIDTLSAAHGQGLLVWYACKKRDEGLSLEEVAAWVESNKLHLCHWFTVDDLMYLKRGGRVSATTALVGTMLNIKPILHVDNAGKLINVGKTRGRKAAIEMLGKKLAELGEGYDNETVFISHGDCVEDAELLARIVKEKYGVKNVLMGYVGAVIGSHSGPGTLTLFFLGKER
jgi:DegV family protein with EDD domain